MSNNPIEGVEAWLAEPGRSMAESLAVSFGIKSANESDAVAALGAWLREPRMPHEQLSRVLSIRAVIDFDCWRFSSPAYQDLIDANLQYAADAGSLPLKNRMAVNEVLGTRQQARQNCLKAAEAWSAARPTEQSIFEWWFDQIPGVPTKT